MYKSFLNLFELIAVFVCGESYQSLLKHVDAKRIVTWY
jgi:hypothetical protein